MGVQSYTINRTRMKLSDAIFKFTAWRQFKVKQGTHAGYHRDLLQLCLYLRDPEVEDIELSSIMDYLNAMIALKWDKQSFITKCTAYRKFFEFCMRQKLKVLDYELIPIPRKNYQMPRVANEEDYKRLLASIPLNNDPRHIRNRAVIMLLNDTGCRNGEVMSFDLNNLNIDRNSATVRTEKTRNSHPFRTVYWTEETNNALKKWLQTRERLKTTFEYMDEGAVFVSISGFNIGHRFTTKGVGEMLRVYCNKAKLPLMNAHSFRHKFGREHIASGVPLPAVSQMMGHSSFISTQIYTILDDETLREYHKMTPKNKP